MFEALVGASVLASAAIALFFLRFWQQTRDRLFLIFALAFAVFAANRILLSALDDQREAQTAVYLARALTFALIALAIADKNWPGLIERVRRPMRRRAASRRGP
jgi:4-hydroxybenzoate polyprenyltransferase